jgi:peroxiredoxin
MYKGMGADQEIGKYMETFRNGCLASRAGYRKDAATGAARELIPVALPGIFRPSCSCNVKGFLV